MLITCCYHSDGTPVVKDEPLSLSQFYSPSAYSGYGDDERSFYSVYRHVFETIVGEDERYMVRPGDARDIPTFGTAGSSYDQVCSVLTNQCTGGCHAQVVGPFYAHWSAYNTARTYTWLNDESEECANRAEARAIEKDNRKLREQAKRARNEEVQVCA
jgi:DnaJ family protein A protein 5